MKKRTIAAAATLGLASLAIVAVACGQTTDPFTGRFAPMSGSEVSAQITPQHAVFETGSAASRCSGTISGAPRIDGNTLTVSEALAGDPRGRACTLTMTRNGSRYSVSESAGCMAFRGASCEFTGTMERVSQSGTRWQRDGMAIDGAWVSEYDLAWVPDQYGNNLVLVVSSCPAQNYHDIHLGVRAAAGNMTLNHWQPDPTGRSGPWERAFADVPTATLRPLDANGRALATFNLRREENYGNGLRAELGASDVAALRSASRIEATSSAGTTFFGARGSSRVIDGLQCMADF